MVPQDAASQQLGQRYLRSWDALGKMLEEGKSWSGSERNVCYLNDGKGGFSNVSVLAGYDQASDSRGQALTDWDGDGDLDVWQTNRTGPRVRFLLNQLEDHETNYLRLHLIGQTCNRDAIGARVTVTLDNGKRLLRSLRGGEGYLSQSSKVLHIGIPKEVTIARVEVLWPGGALETIASVFPGKTYRITQGEGAVLQDERKLAMKPEPGLAPEAVSPNIRLLPHAKLPLPSMVYTDPEGKSVDLAMASEPTLVLLWAPWCQACLAEIQELRSSADQFQKQGLRVLLINVDTAPATAPSFLQGQASPAFLEAYDVLQRALPGRQREAVLPSSFLISGEGELLAHYRGPVQPKTLLTDVELSESPLDAFRDQAVPFPGTWLMRSIPTDLLAIPNSLLELRQTEEAFTYLEKHIINASENTTSTLSKTLIGELYTTAGSQFASGNELNKAKQALIRALQYEPRHLLARERLAQIYEQSSEHGPAIEQFQQVLMLDPKHLAASNSLAWLLATSPDAKLRQPAEAERLARQVNQVVKEAVPEPLDTLAAALAANGKFPEAIATARRGLELAIETGRSGVAKRLQERLSLYESGHAYVQAPR